MNLISSSYVKVVFSASANDMHFHPKWKMKLLRPKRPYSSRVKHK